MEPQEHRTQCLTRVEYVRQLLAAYHQTPGTTGHIRRPDRLLANQLYQRGIPLGTVENALLLAAARRLLRSPDSLPLAPIRSLAYFVPVIDEVLQLQVSQVYFEHIRRRIEGLPSMPPNLR